MTPEEAYQDLNADAPGKYSMEQVDKILNFLYKLAHITVDEQKRTDDQESDNIYSGIN